tara:strand:- start:1414 stop:2217 length:804 start_codon:yes stop_codon:yes gene_type:complete
LRGGRRRGPAKRAPKDIFSPGAKKEQKKPVVSPTPRNQPIAPPTSVTPPKVAGSDKGVKVEKEVVKPKVKTPQTEIKEPQEVKEVIETEKDIEEGDIEEGSKEIIADQIFGSKPKKTRGLKQIKKKEDNKNKDSNNQSDKAAALIEQSRQRAMQPIVEALIEKKEVKPIVTKKRRNTKTSYQPATRAKRLNRSRHMEYKYEMRKLLDDINVPEEHRSNLLGTIWAKGERKTASDAKDFLVEKMSEGAINEEQKSRLEKVIDDYTIRR